MKKFLVIALLSLGAAAAQAGSDFADTEPLNDLPGTADPIGITSVDSAVTVARLNDATDVDWFTVDLNAGETLTAITTPLESLPLNLSSPDTILGVFLPGPALIASNDDAGADGSGGSGTGPTRGSAVRYYATAPTKVLLAVTGFPDFDFDGDPGFGGHGEVGRYALTVSIVPEPASLVGLALAGVAFFRRR